MKALLRGVSGCVDARFSFLFSDIPAFIRRGVCIKSGAYEK